MPTCSEFILECEIANTVMNGTECCSSLFDPTPTFSQYGKGYFATMFDFSMEMRKRTGNRSRELELPPEEARFAQSRSNSLAHSCTYFPLYETEKGGFTERKYFPLFAQLFIKTKNRKRQVDSRKRLDRGV